MKKVILCSIFAILLIAILGCAEKSKCGATPCSQKAEKLFKI